MKNDVCTLIEYDDSETLISYFDDPMFEQIVNSSIDFEKGTPLFYAYMKGSIDCFDSLINHAKIKINCSFGRYLNNILIEIIERRRFQETDEEMLEDLIFHDKLSINDRSLVTYTSALHSAATYDDKIISKILEREDTKVNEFNGNHMTPLMLVCQHNNLFSVKELLKRNDIKVNLKNSERNTALIIAIVCGHDDIVKTLLDDNRVDPMLKNGINKNIKNIGINNSRTPLHFACIYKRPNIVEILLSDSRVNINCIDGQGLMPINYALSGCSEHNRILALFNNRPDTNMQPYYALKEICKNVAIEE